MKKRRRRNRVIAVVMAVVVVAVFAVTMCGCDSSVINYDLIDTNWAFNKAYITIGGDVIEIDVASWRDSEKGDDITITAKDGKVYMCSVQNCVMVEE